jgi:hypothetical protein
LTRDARLRNMAVMNRTTTFALVTALLCSAGCYGSHADEDVADGDARSDADGRDDAGLPDDADVADAADDAASAASIRFRLHFVSDIPESVWVAAWDAAVPNGHWLTLLRDGAAIAKADRCDVCSCDDCPACPICGAPCMQATELPNGGTVEYVWQGFEYQSDVCPVAPPARCERAVTAPPGAYTARFCWGTGVGGTPPCDEEILGLLCEDVPFTVPDADGLVEYTINWGG